MRDADLMTPDAGDWVLDPTCSSETTAFVAEQWGRRWITCDTSRVLLALARQRFVNAMFDHCQVNSPSCSSGRESAPSSFSKDQSRLTSAATRGGEDSPVAILCGPESGPISERLVREAWDEAGLKHYTRLCVIGFAADPKARQFVESGGKAGLPCIHLKATMDLEMGDLLTHMRSSQIFSVCGMPAVAVRPVKPAKAVRSETRNPKSEIEQWQVELLGLDRFDPVTVEADHLKAADVPARFLHTDYSDIAFRVRQSFFLRTGAWENLMNALRLEFEHAGWDHFACTESASFAAGEHGHMAVEVINPRGIELLVAKQLST
jgi:adenine-specific DNA-methyltransferase